MEAGIGEFIPHDIRIKILLRVPGKSLIKFRCVCKLWRSLIDDPKFLITHRDHWANDVSNLAILNTAGSPNLFLPSTNEEIWDTKNMKIKNFRRIFHMSNSCHGLICLYGFFGNIHVFNPTTGEFYSFPINTDIRGRGQQVCGFGFYKEQYKVVRLWKNDHQAQECEVFTLGSNSWKSVGSAPYPLGPYEPVFANQSLIYWLVNHQYRLLDHQVIVSFDLGDEKFRTVPPPPGYICPGSDHGFLSLAKLQGQLCLADARWDDGEMQIWKLRDHISNVWIKEHRIWLRVPACVVIPEMEYVVTPVGIRDGKILIETGSGLDVYDMKSGSQREVYRTGRCMYVTRACVYAESLVSLKELVMS